MRRHEKKIANYYTRMLYQDGARNHQNKLTNAFGFQCAFFFYDKQEFFEFLLQDQHFFRQHFQPLQQQKLKEM